MARSWPGTEVRLEEITFCSQVGTTQDKPSLHRAQRTISRRRGRAASDPPGQDMAEEATCSICLDLLKEPVTINCGHNFCQVCITRYCEDRVDDSDDPVPCPSCRAEFQRGSFPLNTQLKNLVEKIKEQSVKPGKEQTENHCVEHEEKLKLFCEEDGNAICLICRESLAHHSHTVLPIQEAANNYQYLVKVYLMTKAAHNNFMPSLFNAKLKVEIAAHTCFCCSFWKNKVKQQRERIKSECEKLHRFVSEEEQQLLRRLEEEERETLQSLEANVAQLFQQSSSLRKLISEIEKKSQQTPAELLKDVKRTLDRSKDVKLQEAKAVSTELKTQCSIPGMVEMLRKFTVDVTLDPGTAQSELILSEDRKCVRHGDTRQDLPNTPERFDTCVSVLGSEGITGGRRYWEVEVGDKTGWTLGVCTESVCRKGWVTWSPGNGYWVVCLRDEGYEAWTSPVTRLPVRVQPRRVGVFLDYKAGEVSFYNMTDRSHLFSFTDTFSGKLRPFFSPGFNPGGTNAAPLTLCPVPAQS
ncbi:E3 ubiquitin-protein ligase TRIM39-like [Alligator mississippiensis]|uniref:E3 ubiquitin-protein ligase TRIM39-like n=1 Tax=Alligator mississippiensis TaxID=8496 RepID=UPI0028776118|nr:E3 ubiquitin-protein ligase TRIM39-like [Alligator mississippiensis]